MEENKNIKISKRNIMEFDGLKKASAEVVKKYLETINNSSKSIIYATVCMIFFIIGVIGFCAIPTISKEYGNIAITINLIISIVSLIIAIVFLIVDIMDREKILYAQRGTAYEADCFVYDKETTVKKDKEGKEIIHYYVKVEDRKGKYIDIWYEVDKESFENNDKPLKLLVFDFESKRVFDVKSVKMLGIRKKNSSETVEE